MPSQPQILSEQNIYKVILPVWYVVYCMSMHTDTQENWLFVPRHWIFEFDQSKQGTDLTTKEQPNANLKCQQSHLMVL